MGEDDGFLIFRDMADLVKQLILTTMMKLIPTTFLACFLFLTVAQAQRIEMLTSGRETSLRGLCVVNDQVIWVSGSQGTVGKSVDGGATWEWITVPGYEKRDFRDIEAFDDRTAVIVAIAEPGNILKTTDGGKSWKTVFHDTTKGMFLDAMDFYDTQHGIAVGDPIDGKLFIITTKDGGNSWKRAAVDIPALEEGFFAASGTNVIYHKNGAFTAVSGGKVARLIEPGRTETLPIIQGQEMTGPNSIAVHGKQAIIVAGDYDHQQDTTQNCLLSTDGMKTWREPLSGPHGYRSCVAYITAQQLITCGVPGVDISNDGGNTWQTISREGFHVCRKAKQGKAVFLAGGNGRIGKLVQ